MNIVALYHPKVAGRTKPQRGVIFESRQRPAKYVAIKLEYYYIFRKV